ncbi:hypothetical protein MMC12_005894 [Toensbergia leucococca]|nr:hypothetical protein [Toensbergia leucococca]
MSSSAPGGSGPPEEKSKGFTKFIRRASKVLRRGSSNRAPISGIPEPGPTNRPTASAGPSAAPQLISPPAILETPAQPGPTPSVPAAIQQSIRDIRPSGMTTNVRDGPSALTSTRSQQERARALFARYGLTLEPSEWTTSARADAERVEKKIRMRVHRQCHRCQTTFGAEKICIFCQHTRCKKCPRFPAKKSKDPEVRGQPVAIPPIIAVDLSRMKTSSRNRPLTMTSRVTGKEIVRKGPVQRVRRTCHLCATLFHGKAITCESCKHDRCSQCPREPPKLSKHPNGYPGDREETYPLAERHLRTIRTRIRYTCHTCSTTFKEDEKLCASCGHERCDECPRSPPRRPPEGLDEEAVGSVEERMRRLDLSPQASAA